MVERLESLKAGLIGGLAVVFAFLISSFVNTLLLAKYFPALVSTPIDVHWRWLFSGVVAGFSGLLFGVTYRYVIRSDQNPQLKTGAVMAFGLVRGLTQIELGWNANNSVLPFFVLAGESIFWFVMAAIALDVAIQIGWVNPFPSR
ncbi:hypothetical protein FD725_27040 [Nostoc sp. TCL26-01]|nr:hypothetical protein FD725_27040 [Nostoc sp. TCL26-01]